MNRIAFRECSPDKEQPAMRNLEPLLQHYARAWNTTIQICMCGMRHVDADRSENGEVTISFPHEEEFGDRTIEELFWFLCDQPIRKKKTNERNPDAAILFDFYGEAIAHAQGHTLFLNVNVLDAGKFTEEIMCIVLSWGFAQIFSHDPERSRRAAYRIAQRMRLRAAKTKKDAQNRFLTCMRTRIQRKMKDAQSQLYATLQSILTLERSWLVAISEIRRLEEHLETIEREKKDAETLGRDFDKLMRREDIARIDIEGDHTILITTAPLKQIYRPPESASTLTFDIGSYLVAIHIRKNQEYRPIEIGIFTRGSFRNTHVAQNSLGNPGYVCFGPEFNPAFQKLRTDFSVVPMVMLVLTFLRTVEMMPTPSESPCQEYPAERTLRQGTPEYAKARSAYIEFVGTALYEKASRDGRKRVAELQAKENECSAHYAELRNNTNAQEAWIDFLKTKASSRHIETAFEHLYQHPWVLTVTPDEHGGLRLWLSDNSKIPYPVFLWIHLDRGIRLIFPSPVSKARLTTHDHRLNWKEIVYQMYLERVATGEMLQVVENVVSDIQEHIISQKEVSDEN